MYRSAALGCGCAIGASGVLLLDARVTGAPGLVTPQCRTFSHFDAPTVVARLTTAENHRTVLLMGRACSWVLQLCKRNVFDDVRKRVVWAIDPGAGVKCQKFHLQERERQSGYDTANYIGDVDWPLRLAVRACTRLHSSSRKRGPVPRFFVSGPGACPHPLH